jgi:hypothetical protein
MHICPDPSTEIEGYVIFRLKDMWSLDWSQPETRTVWPNSFRGEDFVNEAIEWTA